MKIVQVNESGHDLIDLGGRVSFARQVPQGFTFDRSTNILQVARELRRFLLQGIQVTLCNGRFDFHGAQDPEALRTHLTAWGTKGKTVEEVEDEIIRWLPTQPKKSQVTFDMWECNGYKIIRNTIYKGHYMLYKNGSYAAVRLTLTEALDYARGNS